MRAVSYAWSFPVTCIRWRSHHSIRHSRKPHAASWFHGSVCYRTEVIADRSFTLREWRMPLYLRTFWRYTNAVIIIIIIMFYFLITWPCAWLKDPYFPDIYWMGEIELSTLWLSKVIIWQTDRQTDTTEIIYHAVILASTHNVLSRCCWDGRKMERHGCRGGAGDRSTHQCHHPGTCDSCSNACPEPCNSGMRYCTMTNEYIRRAAVSSITMSAALCPKITTIIIK